MHNIRNTTAAVAACFTIGISLSLIKKGLLNYKGVQKDLMKYLNLKSIFLTLVHHPTEIEIKGLKVYHKKNSCIFQPHRISRLKT